MAGTYPDIITLTLQHQGNPRNVRVDPELMVQAGNAALPPRSGDEDALLNGGPTHDGPSQEDRLLHAVRQFNDVMRFGRHQGLELKLQIDGRDPASDDEVGGTLYDSHIRRWPVDFVVDKNFGGRRDTPAGIDIASTGIGTADGVIAAIEDATRAARNLRQHLDFSDNLPQRVIDDHRAQVELKARQVLDKDLRSLPGRR